MATRQASIMVTHLTSAALYADKFVVEIYSDSGLTNRVASESCAVAWDTASASWKQKNAISINGLTFGSTYYARGGVVAPLSGLTTWVSAYSFTAGVTTSPSATYGGTFQSNTAGVYFNVTPSVTADGLGGTAGIDRYEWVWTLDGTTPASTVNPYGSAHVVGTAFNFYAGAIQGTTITAFVRAVNMNQVAQAWQSLGSFAVSSAWYGTTTGTIGDGALLGTNGGAVYGSGGNSGMGGTPSYAWSVFGNGVIAVTAAANPQFYINNTATGGDNAALVSGPGSTVLYRNGTGRQTINTSGNGFNGTPIYPVDVFGNGIIRASANSYPQLSLTNTAVGGGSSAWYQDVSGQVRLQNGGADRAYMDAGGVLGLGMTPTGTMGNNRLTINGSTYQSGNGDTRISLINTAASKQNWSLAQDWAGGNGFNIVQEGVSGTSLVVNGTGTGIGLTPSYGFNVTASNSVFQNVGDVNIPLYDTTGRSMGLKSSTSQLQLADYSAGSARVNVDASGNFGIGCTPTSPLMMNGYTVVQYASGVPNMVSNVNQSTNFIGQGNIITQDSPTWSSSTSGNTSGSCSITLTITGKTMYRGDGSSFTFSTQTFTWTGLNAGIAYVFYPYYRTSDGTIHFASANTPSPSSTNLDPGTTPLTTHTYVAALNTMQDGRFPLSAGALSQTTNTTTTSGGGLGGGNNTCPEGNTPVTMRRNNRVYRTRIRYVRVGDYLKGVNLETGLTEWRRVKAVTYGVVEEWRKFKGFLITPNHEIRYNNAWTKPKDIPCAKQVNRFAVAVKVSLDTPEYDEQNFWLGDEEVLMHNAGAILSC